MNNRKDAFTSENTNPATKFIEWKSDHQKFAYWDKEKEANIFIELPLKFLAIKQLHTVKGYNPKYGGGIFSNEVEYLSTQELTVKYFKDRELIVKGFWNDIKDKVDQHKGHYALSLYVMLEDGTLANFQLKGATVGQWYEFTKKTKSRLYDEWISVKGYKEGQQGSVNYTYPIFEYDRSLNDEQAGMADTVFATLDLYLNAYMDSKLLTDEGNDVPNNVQDEPPVLEHTKEENDGLPF